MSSTSSTSTSNTPDVLGSDIFIEVFTPLKTEDEEDNPMPIVTLRANEVREWMLHANSSPDYDAPFALPYLNNEYRNNIKLKMIMIKATVRECTQFEEVIDSIEYQNHLLC